MINTDLQWNGFSERLQENPIYFPWFEWENHGKSVKILTNPVMDGRLIASLWIHQRWGVIWILVLSPKMFWAFQWWWFHDCGNGEVSQIRPQRRRSPSAERDWSTGTWGWGYHGSLEVYFIENSDQSKWGLNRPLEVNISKILRPYRPPIWWMVSTSFNPERKHAHHTGWLIVLHREKSPSSDGWNKGEAPRYNFVDKPTNHFNIYICI